MKPPILVAYQKGLDIISSCKRYDQTKCADNYIENFRRMYGTNQYYEDLFNEWSVADFHYFSMDNIL